MILYDNYAILILGVNVKDQLLILKQSQSPWNLIVEPWNSTYEVRQNLIKSRRGTDLWEFSMNIHACKKVLT